jgi:hypothetical protein
LIFLTFFQPEKYDFDTQIIFLWINFLALSISAILFFGLKLHHIIGEGKTRGGNNNNNNNKPCFRPLF